MARKDAPENKRQRKILAFIARKLGNQGYPPTIREIGNAVGITSTSVVNYHLNKLKDAGFIERDDRVSRGLKLSDRAIEGGWDSPSPREVAAMAKAAADAVAEAAADVALSVLRIPDWGTVAAGQPITVPDNPDPDDYIEVAADLVGTREEVFALHVRGDSMIDALINDGDIVVMERVDAADNGDMVAVWLIDEEETTLKRFFLEDGGRQVRLQPANPTMAPFFHNPENIKIQGRVVAVIRSIRPAPLRKAV